MKATAMYVVGLMLLTGVTAAGEEVGGAKKNAPVAAPAAPAATVPAAPAAVARANIDWDGMSKKQKKAYMKSTVLPAAKKMFAELDPEKFKNVTCVTCHGDSAGKDFKMPNPKLPKLPTTPEGFKALAAKKPEAMKFMSTRVKPTMAALLGEQEMSPTTPKGFGCTDCHTKEGSLGGTTKPAK